MKLRNKKFAAGILAVIFAAAMPVSAFAEEVSNSDVADKTPTVTVDDIKESLKDSLKKIPSTDELMDAVTNPDLDAMKEGLDSFNGSIKDAADLPSIDVIKEDIETYYGEAFENVDTQQIKEYLEEFNKLNPDSQVDIKEFTQLLKGNGSTTAPSTNNETTASSTADKYIIKAEAAKAPYLVYPGYDVELPKTATVTYNDGSTEEVPVTWTMADGSPVDSKNHDTIFPGTENEYGYFLIYGTVENFNVKIVKGVRITTKAEKPTESTTTTTEATTTTTEATTTTTEAAPSETTTTTDTVIENVQTGEGNYSMVWVMFMFSAAALAVTVTSRKFRCA